MFGVDFSELIVILVVALIVVGPERLPKVARTLGHLWGRLQRYVNNVKTDISREMAAEEFRQLQQKISQEAMNVEREVNRTFQAVNPQAQQPGNTAPQTDAGPQNAPAEATPEQKKP